MSARSSFAATIALMSAVAFSAAVTAQPAPEQVALQLKQLQQAQEDLDHRLDELAKAIDDVAWFQRVGDVAVVDKWRIAGPPAANPEEPDGPGRRQPGQVLHLHVRAAKDRKPGEKLPLLILPHGGVHADFTTYHAHIIRELMAQGYVVVAPDYRGSTGYGRDFYELIDYGGREVDDIHASARVGARQLRLRRPQPRRPRRLEPRRAHRPDGGVRPPQGLRVRLRRRAGLRPRPAHGLLGRGVPRTLFSRQVPHRQDRPGGHRASTSGARPVWNVDKLAVPLLIHTNTNDEDVQRHRGRAPDPGAQGGGQEVRVQGLPGRARRAQLRPPGHHAARGQARREIYAFLARYLKPPRPLP